MNSQERDLITDLFRRIRGVGSVEKDRDAEALIAEEMRSVPDAPYVMAQTILVQEMALKKADERIRELEAKAASGQRSGGFLGGFLGLGNAANNDAGDRGSVPPVGAAREAPYPRPGEPLPPLRTQPGAPPGQPPGAGGGSFLGTAMATATGVAGGILLGEGLRGLFGGPGAAHAAGTGTAAQKEQPATSTEPHYKDANDNDPGAKQGAEHTSADDDDADYDDMADLDDFSDGIDI